MIIKMEKLIFERFEFIFLVKKFCFICYASTAGSAVTYGGKFLIAFPIR